MEYGNNAPSEVEYKIKIQRLERRVAQLNRFQSGIRANKSNYVSIKDIQASRICCPGENLDSLEICSYPFYYSPKFQTCIQVRCKICGTAWVPRLDFSLEDYYRFEYAEQVQPFRKEFDGQFFDIDNPFWQTPTAKRMIKRADHHLELLDLRDGQSILEVGPGVGIALFRSGLRPRLAAEPDKTCHTILREEVGARLVELARPEARVDGILASHVIEHFPIGQLAAFFDQLKEWAKPGAKLVIEVPQGALHAEKIAIGSRENLTFEPHIISFSSVGLGSIVQRCGLKLIRLSIDELTAEKYMTEFSNRFQRVDVIKGKPIIALCRFP